MSKNAVIALACQIVKLREAARMWKQTAQAHKDQRDIQAANHETRMAELRSSMGVRIDADAQLITSLQAMVKEQSNSAKAAGDLLGWTENESPLQAVERVVTERDALRAEVAALQERLRASIARGDFAQMEVAALKSQTSKQTLCDHPVTVKREPEVGDTVQLVKRPTKQDYEWSWLDDWGKVGDSFRAVSGVCTYNKTPSVLVEIRGKNYSWPLSCVEVVTEATHDTEAGKAAAESAVKTDPVADEIKVGDLVEVFQASYPMTTIGDIGAGGIVVKIVPESAFECEHVQIDSNGKTRIPFAGMASIKDVRKVTT